MRVCLQHRQGYLFAESRTLSSKNFFYSFFISTLISTHMRILLLMLFHAKGRKTLNFLTEPVTELVTALQSTGAPTEIVTRYILHALFYIYINKYTYTMSYIINRLVLYLPLLLF